METVLQYKNIDSTWFLATPFTYNIPKEFITGFDDVPQLNIDSKTLFRIRTNFAILYPEYYIKWAYLEEDNLVRLHLTITPLIDNIEEKYKKLQDLITTNEFPATWYPLFRLDSLFNSLFA